MESLNKFVQDIGAAEVRVFYPQEVKDRGYLDKKSYEKILWKDIIIFYENLTDLYFQRLL